MGYRSTLTVLVLALAVVSGGAVVDRVRADTGGTPWMGVLLGDAVDGGVQVVAIMPGGPAERAKLQRGDLILEAEGEAVTAQSTLRRLLADLQPGDALELIVLRGGEPRALRIELGQRGSWSVRRGSPGFRSRHRHPDPCP